LNFRAGAGVSEGHLLLAWFIKHGPTVVAMAKRRGCADAILARIPRRSAAEIAQSRRENRMLYAIECMPPERQARIFCGVKIGDQLPTGEDDPMDRWKHGPHGEGKFCLPCYEAKYESGQTRPGMLP